METGKYKIEQGIANSPSIHTIIKLADALGILIDELLGRKSLKKEI